MQGFLSSCGFDNNISVDKDGVVTQISFTERAAMRTFCRKLAKFIRLADFFICNSFITIAIHSTHDLLSHMIRGQELVKESDIPSLQALSSELDSKANTEKAIEVEIQLKGTSKQVKSEPLFQVELILSPER